MKKQLITDTWSLAPYKILDKSESAKYQNESSFQSAYRDIQATGLSPQVLCVIEGRFGKNRAISVNGRYYGDNFWDIQLEKEQTQFLLRKGLMWQMFGHVDRGIEDKDAEKGLVAGIVTHLEVVKAPTEINGVHYNEGDLFGRAIIIDMEAGRNTYALLSVGSEISISSRGLGEYIIGETFRTAEGRDIPIMNAETYELETFDFTRLPGISDAEVHTVRDTQSERNLIDTDQHNQKIALLKDIATGESEGKDIEDFEYEFDNESFEISDTTLNLINESIDSLIFNIENKENDMAKLNGTQVQKVLEEANAKIASLTAKLEDAEKAKDNADAKIDELEKELAEKQETVEAGVEPEETVEEPAPIKADAEKEADKPAEEEVDMTELAKFKDIVETPEELHDTLTKVEETLNRCKEDAEELAKVKAELAKKEEELAEKEQELKDAEVVIESYVKLGSIADLSAMVESNQKLKQEAAAQKLAQFAQKYSVQKGITLESVKRIINSSKSLADAKSVLESLPNKDANKGLFKTETVKKSAPEVMTTFAESFINRAENRRTKTYTV